MRVNWRHWCLAVGLAAACGDPITAEAQQRPRFPSQGGPTPTTVAGQAGGAPADAPSTKLAPLPPRPGTAPSATLGNPTFDPYNSGANPGTFQPALPPGSAPSSSGSFGGSLFGGTPGATAGFPAPGASAPQMAPPPGGSLAPPPTTYPSGVYPGSTPPALFPGGLGGSSLLGGGGEPFGMPQAIPFLQGPRLRHTWISGGDDRDELGINTTDTSLAFAFPNFLYSGQPVYVLPSFSLHLWDGPISPRADLPGQAYDAFLEAGWQSDPNQILGAELGLRVGAFTDFDTFNSDSIRTMGQGLAKLRLTPYSTLKAGVMYVDRNDIKIIPAGGLLWQPGPATRFDIFFPNPKFSRYLSTIGTHDVWMFVAGEYGGGSWTIERTSGATDSIDINDIRLSVGLEWGRPDQIRAGRRFGFLEAGWVTDREILYRDNPQDNIRLDDALMVRAGIYY